jgi:hypothetical protein
MVLVAARVLEAEPEILTTSLFSKIFMFLNAMKRSDFHAKVSAVSLGIRIIHSQIWEDDEFILHGKIDLLFLRQILVERMLVSRHQ